METKALRRCPIGIQTFENIREGDYLYVDKTELIHRLVHDYTYVFLNRPRWFGKCEDGSYTLDIPNKEIRIGLLSSLLPHYVGIGGPL